MAIIDYYIESLSNCGGRFRTLKEAYPVVDSQGRPVFTSSSRSVIFRIVYGGRRYLLRCPLSMSISERAATEKLILGVKHLKNPFIARSEYLPSELMIHDSLGKPSWVDVVIELEPDGEPLETFVRGRRMLSDKRPLRELLKGLAAMSAELYDAGLIHGNLHAHNIIVTESGVPVAVGYAMAHDKRTENDTKALALLALNTFIAACGSSVCVEKPARNHTIEDLARDIKHIVIQAEFLRLEPLAKIAKIVSSMVCSGAYIAGQNNAVADRLELNAAMNSLADTPFVPLTLLESLTVGRGEGRLPQIIATPADTGNGADSTRAERTIYADTRADKIFASHSHTDPTLRVNFDKCDFVAPLSDTLIRFCIEGKWGFADRYGNPAVGARFIDAGDFYEGLAVVATAQGYGVIDRRGEFIMEPCFEMVEWYGHDNVIAACADGKWELYGRTGRRLTAGAYDWLGDCSEGTFLARRGNKFGYLLPDGTALTEMRFDDAYSMRGGKATVRSGNETYTIDSEGRKM